MAEYEAEIQRERQRYEHQAKMRAEANAKRKKANNTVQNWDITIELIGYVHESDKYDYQQL